jgi:hypothetical protein
MTSCADAPNYVDLLTSYFDRFGSKPVIVEDLLLYISELDSESEERKKWDTYLSAVELKTVNAVDKLKHSILKIRTGYS